ncbi:MAG: hypothetical protein ACI4D7_10355 [Lachnospiraceae bacterium]
MREFGKPYKKKGWKTALFYMEQRENTDVYNLQKLHKYSFVHRRKSDEKVMVTILQNSFKY